MNRTPAVVLALMVVALTIVVVALVIRDQSFPADAQAALDKYLEYRYSPSHGPPIRQVARSALPWNFSSDLSRATFSDRVLFHTTYNYRAQPVVNLPGSPTVTPNPGASMYSAGEHPVPYPPTDVWCVLLLEENPSAQNVVYVASHQDLYNADWLVHEPAGDSKEIADALSKIGCDVKLGSEGTH